MESWGVGARAFLTDVGSRVKQATGSPRVMEFLRQRVSIEIQRGNAASVMGTVDNAKDWSAFFYYLRHGMLTFLCTPRNFGLLEL